VVAYSLQRNPPPPKSAARDGLEATSVAGEVLFLPQHVICCFPLASMVQNTFSSLKDAAMEDMPPFPHTSSMQMSKKQINTGP